MFPTKLLVSRKYPFVRLIGISYHVNAYGKTCDHTVTQLLAAVQLAKFAQ